MYRLCRVVTSFEGDEWSRRSSAFRLVQGIARVDRTHPVAGVRYSQYATSEGRSCSFGSSDTYTHTVRRSEYGVQAIARGNTRGLRWNEIAEALRIITVGSNARIPHRKIAIALAHRGPYPRT